MSSLEELARSRGKSDVSTKGSEDFKMGVEVVQACGYTLQRLTKGAALKMHLKTIAPLLVCHHQMSPSRSDEEQENLNEDSDLKAVQPFVAKESTSTTLLIWKSYFDWLSLMIAHFDAVEILVGYVTKPGFQYDTISVKILVPPAVDQQLLPWSKLLGDSTLFPTETVWDNHGISHKAAKDNASITNADIIDFLENAVKFIALIKGVKTTWDKKDVKNTKCGLQSLFKSTKLKV